MSNRTTISSGTLFAAIALGLLMGSPTPAAPQAPTYTLKATLKPQHVFQRPDRNTAVTTAGRFTSRFELDYRGSGGYAIWPRLTFTGLTSRATAAHIHYGRPNGFGRILITLCSRPEQRVKGCPSPLEFFRWEAAVMDDVLTGPTYVDVHTTRNPRGELRGQIEVVTTKR